MKYTILTAICVSLLGIGSPGFGDTPPSSPLPSVIPSPSAAPLRNLTLDEARRLRSQFQKAQWSELGAFDHRKKFEIREMDQAHKARLKEFDTQETKLRHDYFREHTKGPEKRAYIKDFKSRQDILVKELKNQRAQKVTDYKSKREGLVSDQQEKQKEFEFDLGNLLRPRESLWPTPGQ